MYLGVSVCVICVYDFVCARFSADSWHCQCAECLAVFRISMIIEESLFSYIYYLPVPITQLTQPAVSPSRRKNTPSVPICFFVTHFILPDLLRHAIHTIFLEQMTATFTFCLIVSLFNAF